MKRSFTTLATMLGLSAALLTGCGESPSTAVPMGTSMSTTSPIAMTGGTMTSATYGSATYGSATTGTIGATGTTAAAATSAVGGTGSLSLNLSALSGVASLQIALSGPGITQAVSKTLEGSDLNSNNIVTFDGVPAAGLSVMLTAYDANGNTLGQQLETANVTANSTTQVALQLAVSSGQFLATPTTASALNSATNAASGLTSAIGSATQTAISGTTAPATTNTLNETQTAAPSSSAALDPSQALSIQITSQSTFHKDLILKRLAVTAKVTNNNPTQTLSGQVVVQFYSTPSMLGSLFGSSSPKLLETQTQAIQNLGPGQSTTISLNSTTSAGTATATVSTVVASSSDDGSGGSSK